MNTTTVRAAGPYDTEQQARTSPEVRAIWQAVAEDSRRGVIAEGNAAMLGRALDAAGVQLGAYDRRIVSWLGIWEPQVCAVIAGLISRAAAGRSA